MADDKKPASNSSSDVTVVMGASAKGFKRGQKVKVDAETAAFLVDNGHAKRA